jgi:hypothetical protein
VESWQWWSIAALALGFLGAIANGYASSKQLSEDRLTLGPNPGLRRWSRIGWMLVGLGLICGVIATVVA